MASSEVELSTAITVILPLIMLCQLLSSYLGERFPKVMRYLPEVGVIILVGIASGILIEILTHYDVFALNELESFSPTLFFVVLLPPIIFNSGFHLKRALFFVNFVPIMVFAIVGTLISAAVISCGLHYLHKAGLLTPSAQSGPHQSMDGLTWAECWAFASLISATDPVSTLVLFAELRVEPHLFYLVFGESVMNDAVGLVLFDTAKDFITDPSLGTGRLFKAVGTFVLNLGGSLAVGILLTVLMAALVKHSQLKHNLVLEQGLVVLFVWLPYVVGEVLSLSGIVTTLTAGMAARKFIYVNLNEASQEGVVGMLRMLSNFAETAAFLNLGTTCVLHNRRYYNPALIAWSILLCCVSRPLQVYGLSSLMKCMGCLQRDLDTKTQRMLSFSGLRGVVAFACVTLWPNDPSVMDDEELDRRKIFVATTSVVILFTVFVQGGLTFQVLTWLRIDMGVDEDKLKVVEEKPGFVKWGSRFVDKWVAPIALSPLQMALQRASKADGIVSEEAWFAQQRGLHLDYSLGGGGGGGEVGNFSNGGVGGGPPSTAVASIGGRADGGNRLTSLPDDSEEGDDDAKAREQSLGGCGLTFSQSMSSEVDRKEGGMASGDGGAVVRDGQGGGNSFLSAVSVLSASSNQQSPNYRLNEPLLPQHQSEEAQPGTSHSSTGFERTTSARNSGSPRTTSSVSSVYDFGRHTARSCTQASADSDSLRKDKDFFARMTALAARSSSNNNSNNNNNNNNNNSGNPGGGHGGRGKEVDGGGGGVLSQPANCSLQPPVNLDTDTYIVRNGSAVGGGGPERGGAAVEEKEDRTESDNSDGPSMISHRESSALTANEAAAHK